MSPPTACFLFDNGSLRPEATLGLRAVAAELEKRLGQPVLAVSLLHSSAVDANALGGSPAQLLEPALKRALSEGLRSVVLLPLFFGPSGALTEYLPDRVRSLLSAAPGAEVRLARWLVDPADRADRRIAQALARRVRDCFRERGLTSSTHVVLVDHGSPQPDVAAVRNRLGQQMGELLANEVAGVSVASMERRPGPDYEFNEPLLAERLRTPPCDRGEVVIALQFVSPGRHAGPHGDVAKIAEDASAERPALRVYLTETMGSDPHAIEVLAERFYEALKAPTLRPL